MNDLVHLNGIRGAAAESLQTPVEAKARLMAWAEEHDARKIEARSSLRSIAARGGLAVLGGMLVARVLTPPRRGAIARARAARLARAGALPISWASVARGGRWLLPHAILAVLSTMKRRGPNG